MVDATEPFETPSNFSSDTNAAEPKKEEVEFWEGATAVAAVDRV